jgi:hypothetical protein
MIVVAWSSALTAHCYASTALAEGIATTEVSRGSATETSKSRTGSTDTPPHLAGPRTHSSRQRQQCQQQQ